MNAAFQDIARRNSIADSERVDVINYSVGTTYAGQGTDFVDQANEYRDVLRQLQPTTLVVVAAGNESLDVSLVPALGVI